MTSRVEPLMAGFLGGGVMTLVGGATNGGLSEKQQGLETDEGGAWDGAFTGTIRFILQYFYFSSIVPRVQSLTS